MNELTRLIETIKQQTSGITPGHRFLEFRSGTDPSDVKAIGIIDQIGGVYIMGPDQMIEAADKAKQMIRDAMAAALARRSPFMEFEQPPVSIAFDILFGEIAKLRGELEQIRKTGQK